MMQRVCTMTRAEKETLPELRGRAEDFLTKTRDEIRIMPPRDAAELVYELQVHQLELKMQNDELMRTQDELRTSRQKYRDLYDGDCYFKT
jgi:two-component system, cell cycle sensor histidine kinase and response regulator CckA